MMHLIPVFILTHGDLAFAYKSTLEKIMGNQEHIYPFSNKIDSLPDLMNKIQQLIGKLNAGRIVIFVDLVGGSCWTLVNMLMRENNNIVAISGVNLPMLISCFTNRDVLAFDELIKKVITDAKRGILIQSENT